MPPPVCPLGALGAGGSILTVPALIYLLGHTLAAATTASLVVVIVTSVTALVAHARAGAVRWRAGLQHCGGGAAARRGGRRPVRARPGGRTDSAVRRTGRTGRPAHAAPPRPARQRHRVGCPGGGGGAGLGAVTGFLGVGGGFPAVPALVTVLGRADERGGGHESAGGHGQRAGGPRGPGVHRRAPGSHAAPAVPGHRRPGRVDGRRLAAKVPRRAALRRVFGAVLLSVAVAMGATAVL
ncbi:sulfite exporter TauE/SafE family protein [Streptomyces thinghirensis]|nr:sulfite exporter TauE/SafE family protein [Streptomyces thinghirensis]